MVTLFAALVLLDVAAGFDVPARGLQEPDVAVADGPTPVAIAPLGRMFSPPHDDSGDDANGNGLYDFLVVNASITVDSPDNYTVGGLLYDANFTLFLAGSATLYLDPGPGVLSIRYSGPAIRSSEADGPYFVDLILLDGAGLPLDNGTHITDPWLHTQFDPVPVAFAPPHSDAGIDTDDDDRFNFLVVNVSLTVNVTGTYGVVASLRDSAGTLDLTGDAVGTFDPGPATLPVAFSGSALNASGVDGPYLVELALYDNATPGTILDVNHHDTGNYSHLDFEEPPSILSPFTTTAPVIDGALDADEWAAAHAEDLAAIPGNQVPAFLYVMHDSEFIYVAYDAVGDTTEDEGDVASIAFDTGNDGNATRDHEDEFVQGGWVPNNQAHLTHTADRNWSIHDSPFNPDLPNHTGLAGDWGFGSSPADPTMHRIYELKIPLVLIGAAPGDTLGFFGGSHPAPGVADFTARGWSTWPDWVLGPIPLNAYGDLILVESGDTVAPTIAITSPRAGALVPVDTVTIEWIASDDGSGLDHFEVRLDRAPPVILPATATSHTLSNVAEGIHNVSVTAFDAAGNSQSDYRSFRVDTLPPTLQVTAPIDESATRSTTVLVTWSASDAGSGISGYEIRLDDEEPIALPPSEASRSFGGLTEGSHRVELVAFDNAGRSTTATASFTVDMRNPTVTIVGPTEDFLGTDSIEVRWSAADAGSGVANVRVGLDSEDAVTLAETSTSHTFMAVGDGSHAIHVTAIDAAGNNASATVTVSVDTVNPRISIDSPAAGGVLHTSDVTISFTASDAASGVDRLELRVDNGSIVALGSATRSHVVTRLPDGDHTLVVFAYDRAGNAATDSVRVRVDTAFLSPTGPYGFSGIELVAGLIAGTVVGAIVVHSRRRARKRGPDGGE